MHLKRAISKKLLFYSKKWQSPKICCFLEISPFRCILSQSFDPIFGISVKLRNFNTHKVIFWEKKISDLIKWFWSKKIFHKNQSRAETTQNNEKLFFYFSLWFPTRIHFSVSKKQILKKVKNPPYCVPVVAKLRGGGGAVFKIWGLMWFILHNSTLSL